MKFLRLPAEEAALRRFGEELWLPYQRDYEDIVEGFELADDVEILDKDLAFRMEQLESNDHRILVALADAGDGDEVDFAAGDGDPVGFVETGVDEAPDVFERPDRLIVCELYVVKPYRGEGLARELMGRASDRAREEGCGEVRLDVDVENERAIRFYEKLGFEPFRYRMLVETGELSERTR